MEIQLGQARKRLASQEVLYKGANETMVYGKKHGMSALVLDAEARMARVGAALRRTRQLVEELEKASGALPLK